MQRQITIKANEATVKKLTALKRLTGLSKLALVDRAVENMINEIKTTGVINVDVSKAIRGRL